MGAILDNELFKRFNVILGESELGAPEREAVRDMVIDAFTEAMHEN